MYWMGLEKALRERVAGLEIAGSHSPPFRPLSPEEERQTVDRINASGAGIVFLGLGCPRQEIFADEHRQSIKAVQTLRGRGVRFSGREQSDGPGVDAAARAGMAVSAGAGAAAAVAAIPGHQHDLFAAGDAKAGPWDLKRCQ